MLFVMCKHILIFNNVRKTFNEISGSAEMLGKVLNIISTYFMK